MTEAKKRPSMPVTVTVTVREGPIMVSTIK